MRRSLLPLTVCLALSLAAMFAGATTVALAASGSATAGSRVGANQQAVTAALLNPPGNYLSSVGVVTSPAQLDAAAGLSPTAITQLDAGIVSMDPGVGFKADQLTQALAAIVSQMNNVIPPAQRVTDELMILRASAEGSQVGASDLQDTTEAVTAVLRAWHETGAAAQRVVAALDQTVKSGGLTMRDVVNAVDSGATPLAMKSKIGLPSVAAALSVLGDAGIRGVAAGRRLRKAVTALAAPSRTTVRILSTLALSVRRTGPRKRRLSLLRASREVRWPAFAAELRRPDGLRLALSNLKQYLRTTGASGQAADNVTFRAFGGGEAGSTVQYMTGQTALLGRAYRQIEESARRFPQSWQATAVRIAQGGTVLFDGSTKLGWIDQSASAARVTEVPDPAGGGGTALRVNAVNSDLAPLTPTDNPRAQLITPNNILNAGHGFWESYEMYLPSSFPTAQTYGGWLALGSPFFGAPWGGSPSTGLEIADGEIKWRTNAYAPVRWAVLWQTPVVTGQWIRFTWHIVPAANGFAELYVNDQPIEVNYNGQHQQGVNIPVIDQTNSAGPWYSQLSAYYEHDEFSQVTIYFKNFAIGSTQQASEN